MDSLCLSSRAEAAIKRCQGHTRRNWIVYFQGESWHTPMYLCWVFCHPAQRCRLKCSQEPLFLCWAIPTQLAGTERHQIWMTDNLGNAVGPCPDDSLRPCPPNLQQAITFLGSNYTKLADLRQHWSTSQEAPKLTPVGRLHLHHLINSTNDSLREN